MSVTRFLTSVNNPASLKTEITGDIRVYEQTANKNAQISKYTNCFQASAKLETKSFIVFLYDIKPRYHSETEWL